MILANFFLRWIFLKSASTCSRGSTVYKKNNNNLVGYFKMRGRGLKCRKFVLSDRPLEATESILQYFLHAKFSDFFKKMDFFIIPGVSRTFDIAL